MAGGLRMDRAEAQRLSRQLPAAASCALGLRLPALWRRATCCLLIPPPPHLPPLLGAPSLPVPQGRGTVFMQSNEHSRERQGVWNTAGLEGPLLRLVEGDRDHGR